MSQNVTQKLIESHLVAGELQPGELISLHIDQTLTQDATGTLVMLELEALGLDRARTNVSVQYVDHNLIQEDSKNPDDHLFLMESAQRFGIWFSRAGNGVSHPVHQEAFGVPGATMLGSDSHTPAAGAIGMLAMGSGGIDVAMAIAGRPYHMRMPEVWGVKLTGKLPDWVSAKDVVLEMLRRHGVRGGRGRVIEYYGPGLEELSAMDRHVIANMGTELGATSTVFPSDKEVRRFLRSQGREDAWTELIADPDCRYDVHEEIDLGQVEPLIALPSSPGDVVPVREVAGRPVYQAYIGSSANPGFRDFAIAAEMVESRPVDPRVSFDVNPTSRQILKNLVNQSFLAKLISAGARIHQAGCNGCIGMGQAPATNKISLRTVPRNFPGRSGSREDQVYLCSPETATAAALTGEITDPRELGMAYPKVSEPEQPEIVRLLVEPPPQEEAEQIEPHKGPNIHSLPELEPVPDSFELPILLKAEDDISTDEILPAGTRVLPYRSNIPKISEFAFEQVAPDYHRQALDVREDGGHVIIGGFNYGQGSSREHAALAPRYLGLRVVIAKSYARIHRRNLVNFGVLPLIFAQEEDADLLETGDTLSCGNVHAALQENNHITFTSQRHHRDIETLIELSQEQRDIILAGGLINYVRGELQAS